MVYLFLKFASKTRDVVIDSSIMGRDQAYIDLCNDAIEA